MAKIVLPMTIDMKGLWALGCAAALALSFAGCSASDDGGAPAAATDCGITVDAYKELFIVDEAVIADPRTSNAQNGPWSFRHAVESMVPEGSDPSAFILGWLNDWAQTKSVNGFNTDRESRVDAMQDRLVCPWLRRTAGNECDDHCTTCKAKELDLAQAPFRLTAITNRMDLQTRPDVASPAGEGRLVFALTDGAADDPAVTTRAMGLIFEYALPESLTPKQWAETWHALGKHAAFDESFKEELAALTERYVGRNARPGHPNGSSLAQVRTNESAFNWIWQLRQFELTPTGDLRLAATSNTPGAPLNNTTELRDYVLANADKIKNDQHVLPRSMLAGSADQFLFRWTIPGVDERTREAFAQGTCNGCHSGEKTPTDVAFHVSPFKKGQEKLSPFVVGEEIPKRTAHLKKVLCTAQ